MKGCWHVRGRGVRRQALEGFGLYDTRLCCLGWSAARGTSNRRRLVEGNQVTKFTPDCDFPGTVAFRTSMENQAEVVGLKLKELSTALAANPKWSGCQCKVPVDFSSIAATMLPDDVDLSQAGSEPWAGLVKLNAWRFGPGATSLPGVGAFYMPLSKQALILTVIPLSLVLKEGVSLKDTKAFLDTREGLKVPAGLLMDEAITKRMLKNPNMFLDILTTC
jgi:hypothetical protein